MSQEPSVLLHSTAHDNIVAQVLPRYVAEEKRIYRLHNNMTPILQNSFKGWALVAL